MKGSSSSITPFPPRKFPPRKLHHKVFSAHLRKATQALKEYASALAVPFPISLLSPLMTLETMASLDSQRLKISFKDQLLSPKQNSIFHYSQALRWACQNISKTPITERLLCTLHKKIKQGTAPNSELGVYRKKQNWIGPADVRLRKHISILQPQNRFVR